MASDIASLPNDEVMEFPYRSISRLALGSIFLFAGALIGLVPIFEPVLALAAVGVVCAFLGVRSITRYPQEYGGLAIAKTGIALNAIVLVGGVGLHVYIYMTEVPDGYERVQFYELERTEGPDSPTDKALSIDGKDVFLKGYIHPASGDGELKQFVLVPDLGTCCFGGQPRSSSMIEVKLTGTKTTRYGRRKLKLAGRFQVNDRARKKQEMDNLLFYRLTADYLK